MSPARLCTEPPPCCPFSQGLRALLSPLFQVKGEAAQIVGIEPDDLSAGKRLISLREAVFRVRFPLNGANRPSTDPPFGKSGHRVGGLACSRLTAPTTPAAPVPATFLRQSHHRCPGGLPSLRERSLAAALRCGGRPVPDTLSGVALVPWGTGRHTLLTRG